MTSAYAADPVFEANAKQVSYLLQRIYNKDLALPEFQRDFVWDTRSTIELLRSIMSRYPAGTLLFWKQSESGNAFASRAVDGAPPLYDKNPDELVLDGQQRLTALYRALNGVSEEKYFVRLRAFLSEFGEVRPVHDVDFDTNPIFAVDGNGKTDQEWQFEEGAFPLADLNQFDEWLDNYARKTATSTSGEQTIKKKIRAVRDAYLVPLKSYGFPVVTLPASTPLEAVCNIFETLNRTGKALGAFDLLTAQLYPHGVNLRELWDEALESNPIFTEFDIEPYALLQAVCLRAHGSAQRSDVLNKLRAKQINDHWASVVAGAAAVLDIFQSEYGVLGKKWLPYGMLLVPLAATWLEVRELSTLKRSKALDRMARYFWCTTFMTNFDQGANSQAGADYGKLKHWLLNEANDPPEAVKEFNLTSSRIRSANVRRKALHAGIMALTIRTGAKDFHMGQKLTAAKVQERKVDSHHVFPKAFLKDPSISELILNRALIDSDTNRTIGKQAPSAYLKKIRDVLEPEKLKDILDSHAVSSGPNSGLEQDDYEAFLTERLNSITVLIEEVTGHQVSPE